MRRAIVAAVAAACTLGILGGLAYLMAAAAQDDGQNWRQHKLAFLKAAYERIQANIAAGGSAAPSWGKQAESVLREMAEVAKPMPTESIPSDISALLSAAEPPRKDEEAAAIGPETMEQSAAIAAAPVAAAPPSDDGVAATPPAAVGFTPAPSEASREASSAQDISEARLSVQQPPPPVAAPDAPRAPSQLEAALQVEKTERGLRILLPVDSLFGSAADGALEPAADPSLSSLAGLIRAMGPREIVVSVHGDTSAGNAPNPALSKKRAHAVAAWLAAHGPEHKPRFIERSDANTRPAKPKKNGAGSDNTEAPQEHREIEVLLRRN